MKVYSPILALALAPAVVAFQLPSLRAGKSSLKATTLNPNGSVNGVGTAGAENPSTWVCDDDVNCVEVPACDETICRTSLDVRIHGNWYDLSGTYRTGQKEFVFAHVSPSMYPHTTLTDTSCAASLY
jgi:hypothetical protein